MPRIINCYFPALPVMPGAQGAVCAALVSPDDKTEDYDVYVGIVPKHLAMNDLDRKKAAEWVAANGAKESFKRAQYFFPTVSDERYRR